MKYKADVEDEVQMGILQQLAKALEEEKVLIVKITLRSKIQA